MDVLYKFSKLGLAYLYIDGEGANIIYNKELIVKVYRSIRAIGDWKYSSVEKLPFKSDSQVEIYVDKGDIIYAGTVEHLNIDDTVLEGDYKWREIKD